MPISFLSFAAGAAEDPWGGSVVAVSDYASRGLSLTRGDPALQAGVFRRVGAWSLGAAASTVDLGDWVDASYELSANLTRTWALGEAWSVYAAYTRYLYPGEYGEYDYSEWTGSLSYRNLVTATLAYFPDATFASRGMPSEPDDAMSYELATLQPLTERWSFLAGLGYYELPDRFDTGYWFWSTGFAFSWNALQVDLVHIDTDSKAVQLFGSERAGNRWSAALMWKF